ncbi:MAG: sigma-54 dependent transcriptional regulator [bacterium]
MKHRVLIVEDDPSMREMLVLRLGKRGFEVTGCASAEEAQGRLDDSDFDAVVTDLNLGTGQSGTQLCEWIVANRPRLPVIVNTAFGSMDVAIEALRRGAYDFINKPVEIEVLAMSLQRAIQARALRDEVIRLRREAAATPKFEAIIGESPGMQRVFSLVERVAQTDASVLITGESGTGKELVARAIHQRSKRAAGPFLAVSCAAMPETLLESELFGYKKGAFTDAKTSKTGLLVQANGGSFFLDELGELPRTLQPKLLRTLEERCVRPVGGSAEVAFDTRLIAATNVELEQAAAEGLFREDLYYRINVVHIRLPPLRERGADVLALAQHFVEQFAARMDRKLTGFSQPAAQQLLSYTWPGNVRELRNCVERAVALTRNEEISPEDLPERIQSYEAKAILVAIDEPAEIVPMREVERRYIAQVLRAVNGSKTTAAKLLGFDRKTLYRKMTKYGLGGPDDEP